MIEMGVLRLRLPAFLNMQKLNPFEFNKMALVGCMLGLAPIGFLSCSLSPNVSGVTDTETGGVIAGVVLDSGGNCAPGVKVTIIPDTYNPVRDEPLPDSQTVLTDQRGEYRFAIGINHGYNIYAERPTDRTRFLHTRIVPGTNGEARDTGVLARTGFLMVILSDTVDTNKGYLYFKGTRIWSELKKTVPYGIGALCVIFDALPSSVMPQLFYACRESNNGEALIASSIDIIKSDSVVFTTLEAAIKPLWRFSLLVGVKDTISRYFGGIERITPLVNRQLFAAAHAFNAARCFNGEFLFVADSIYEYSGAADNEGPAPLSRFHYRLLYDDMGQQVSRNQAARCSYGFLANAQPDTLFGDRYTLYLAKVFGQLRGALDLSWIVVDSTKNMVNKAAFHEVPSIMSDPLKYTTWDDYSISIINYNAGNVGSERGILAAAFADTLGIAAVSAANGSVISDAEIIVYRSALNSRTLSSDRILIGSTDKFGRSRFLNNPFLSDSTGNLVYGNLLITMIASTGDTASAWFPVCEAGNAYFKNPAASYYKVIRF
jgi:hypothetical protein